MFRTRDPQVALTRTPAESQRILDTRGEHEGYTEKQELFFQLNLT